jgi:hypothetical protein
MQPLCVLLFDKQKYGNIPKKNFIIFPIKAILEMMRLNPFFKK